jgi:hypothetical protein
VTCSCNTGLATSTSAQAGSCLPFHSCTEGSAKWVSAAASGDTRDVLVRYKTDFRTGRKLEYVCCVEQVCLLRSQAILGESL